MLGECWESVGYIGPHKLLNREWKIDLFFKRFPEIKNTQKPQGTASVVQLRIGAQDQCFIKKFVNLRQRIKWLIKGVIGKFAISVNIVER